MRTVSNASPSAPRAPSRHTACHARQRRLPAGLMEARCRTVARGGGLASHSRGRGRASTTQWIQIRLAGREHPSSNISLQLGRLGSVGDDNKPIGQPLAHECTDETVERQGASGDLLPLRWVELWHHKAVTDVDAELISRATARRMGVEPGPQSLRHDPAAIADSRSSAVMARPLMPTYSSRSPSQTV
jgi:hypothetical protein